MRMSLILFGACLVLAVACGKKDNASNEHAHHASSPAESVPDTTKKSIPKETHAMVGGAHITINYYSPAVRGRVIWGGLVPYDEVWVTGAHRATNFEIDKDFLVGPTTIPVGKYAIFTIPGKDVWTVIFNKNWDQHLADEYTEADDVVRVNVTPEVSENLQERLIYSIEEKDGNVTLVISWEKIRLSVPLAIKKGISS